MLILRSYLDRWRSWRESSANRGIFAGMLTIGALTVLVKLVTISKELLIAYRFGTGDDLDAYLTALALPLFAVNVFAGSFQSAFLPVYLKARHQQGPEAAEALFAANVRWGTALLLGITAALLLTSPISLPLLGSGYNADKLALTRAMFVVLVPLVVLGGLGQMLIGVLNARERFAPGALIPGLSPALIILGLLVFGTQLGAPGMALALLIGASLEAGLLAFAHRRQSSPSAPADHRTRTDLVQIGRQYAPIVLGQILLGSTSLVDQAVAAGLGSGSVSTLSYGSKLGGFLLGIGALAMGTAVFPTISNMVAARDQTGVTHTLRRFSQLIIAASLPAMLFFLILSRPMVVLIFERGEFTSEATALVSLTQAVYALQIPFFLLGMLYARFISAMSGNHILLISAIISVPLNIGLDLLFSRWFGVPGIALATVCVYIVSSIYLFVVTRSLVRNLA